MKHVLHHRVETSKNTVAMVYYRGSTPHFFSSKELLEKKSEEFPKGILSIGTKWDRENKDWAVTIETSVVNTLVKSVETYTPALDEAQFSISQSTGEQVNMRRLYVPVNTWGDYINTEGCVVSTKVEGGTEVEAFSPEEVTNAVRAWLEGVRNGSARSMFETTWLSFVAGQICTEKVCIKGKEPVINPLNFVAKWVANIGDWKEEFQNSTFHRCGNGSIVVEGDDLEGTVYYLDKASQVIWKEDNLNAAIANGRTPDIFRCNNKKQVIVVGQGHYQWDMVVSIFSENATPKVLVIGKEEFFLNRSIIS